MAAPVSDPWMLFLTVAGAHALGVASPGPDFAVVVRETVRAGRRAGILAALGIGSGILFHVGYGLFGLGWLTAHWPGLLVALRYGGAALLAWLGFSALRPPQKPAPTAAAAPAPTGTTRSFWLGLGTNVLNVKAMLFFVALFSAVITRDTPLSLRVLLGAWLCAATAAWFCLVATTVGHATVRRRLLQMGPWLDRAMGLVFLALAVVVLGFFPGTHAT